MPLFNPRIIKKALETSGAIPPEKLDSVRQWAAAVRDGSIRQRNESQLEADFKSRIMEGLLGYTPFGTGASQTIQAKQPMGAGIADLALGRFDGAEAVIIAPFELKGPDTRDLDAPMPGRRITPVQQAWGYANAVRGVRWVLLTNMLELRLYAFGEGNQTFEAFDLGKIDQPAEYAKLQLLLSAGNLLDGPSLALLGASRDADKDVSERLYGDYKALRDTLIGAVNAATENRDPLAAISTAQKILDRVLFIAFAEDSLLLPEKSLDHAVKNRDLYNPRPIWHNFKSLFRAIDVGNSLLKIDSYNGGLFRLDPAVDELELPDAICNQFRTIGEYDFASEVGVTILGHIFEQSVADIERLQARARGEETEPEKKTGTSGRRKRDGIVYTPDYIARFIAARTLGTHIEDLFWSCMGALATGAEHRDYVGLKFGKKKSQQDAGKLELQAWRNYRLALKLLRVVDPACGSGVFLVTAFDLLRTEYDRVNKKIRELLDALGEADLLTVTEDIDREILSQNLYGVDVNEESVEITKLSLWLKTARKGKKLDSLDHTIRVGDSLIEDSNFAYLKHGFEWRKAFPEVFAANGGFDVVLGTPPYVRMELIKAMKPFLETRYEVVSDRADLYAYFFERGLRLLRPDGRLGFISSSTFFKTGSGAPLRRYLLKEATIETVTDFGDLQIFGGVTTYPAILTMRKQAAPDGHAISFWKVGALPEADFGEAFEAAAQPFPQAKLGAGSWELENPALRALREKIVRGRKTLKEVYGSPLYGIKTGLNEAFIVDRATHDRLLLEDAKSAELLKPFLEGKDLKRWRAEPRDLWIIYIPKNAVDIDRYPAIKSHLLPFREQLEARATEQAWFELQQAQAAYVPAFEGTKIVYVDIADRTGFSLDRSATYLANTAYFLPHADSFLLGLMNSKVAWTFLTGTSAILRGGFIRLFTQNVEKLPVPTVSKQHNGIVSNNAEAAWSSADQRCTREAAFRRRIPDLCPPERDRKLNTKLCDWWELPDFAAFRAEVKKHYKADIPLADRDDWQNRFDAEKAEIERLAASIARNEAEIDAVVYRLFELTPDEIALLEASIR